MNGKYVLEMIENGKIEELKKAAMDEIYQKEISSTPGAKQRYTAMKRTISWERLLSGAPPREWRFLLSRETGIFCNWRMRKLRSACRGHPGERRRSRIIILPTYRRNIM